jgi:hypothetical protein
VLRVFADKLKSNVVVRGPLSRGTGEPPMSRPASKLLVLVPYAAEFCEGRRLELKVSQEQPAGTFVMLMTPAEVVEPFRTMRERRIGARRRILTILPTNLLEAAPGRLRSSRCKSS